MNIFEIIMLVCFGLAWPFSIVKAYKSKTNGGKSLWFLVIIFIGYLSGVIYKALYSYDGVILLYLLNTGMVLVDIILYIYNEYFIYALSTEEEGLYKNHFFSMPRSVFCGLLKLAQYQTIAAGELFIKEGLFPEELFYILKGNVKIIKNNRVINEVSEHSFLGEMSFLTPYPATANVIAIADVKCLVWKKTTLKKYREILNHCNICLAVDLVNKIKSTEGFKNIVKDIV